MVINMVKSVHKFEDQVHGGLYDTPADAMEAERADVSVPKKIVVDCCEYCPLKEKVLTESSCIIFVCSNQNTFGRKIENVDVIPDWCKLGDE